jgi:hypothetical protein
LLSGGGGIGIGTLSAEHRHRHRVIHEAITTKTCAKISALVHSNAVASLTIL